MPDESFPTSYLRWRGLAGTGKSPAQAQDPGWAHGNVAPLPRVGARSPLRSPVDSRSFRQAQRRIFVPRRDVRGRGAQAEGVVDQVLCHRTIGLDHQHHELAQQRDLFLENVIVDVFRRFQRYQFGLAFSSGPETLKPAGTHSNGVDSGVAT